MSTTTTDAMKAHNAALIAKLLERGAIPPERKPLALALAGITQGDLWAAQRAPYRNPTPTPQPPRYRPSVAPKQPEPPPKWCVACNQWLKLTAFTEGRSTCSSCLESERERYRRKEAAKAAERAAQSALNKALVSLVTVKVRADGLGMELVCRGCRLPIREGAEVGGVICVECSTKGDGD